MQLGRLPLQVELVLSRFKHLVVQLCFIVSLRLPLTLVKRELPVLPLLVFDDSVHLTTEYLQLVPQ